MEILRLEGITKKFGKDFTAVNNISFTINQGEILGLVGESGSGKTTAGRTIIGLYKADAGKIFFEGKELKPGKINPEIQMIFQDPVASLNPRMTVGEIIAEGLRIQKIKDEKLISEKVIEMLNTVGLNADYINRYPHEFSGGQRQRIGIARALIMNPKLIIADECVSALDVSIKAQIINLLTELKRSKNLSILFIAHDLSTVRCFCDKTAVMYKGQIVELNTSEEIFTNPQHDYTKALISAIPLPDPKTERNRTRLIYENNK